jgi:short subunit dehydrogenase-like uncharacterized protein
MSVAVSWPDVVTAYKTTGVGDIEAFMEAPLPLRFAHRAGAMAADIVGDEALQTALTPLEMAWPEHPSAGVQSRATATVVVEALDPWGRATRFGLNTLDGYTTTMLTASAIVGRVLAGEHPPGFQTPASAYGPELVQGLGCAEPYDAGRLASNSVTVRQAGTW